MNPSPCPSVYEGEQEEQQLHSALPVVGNWGWYPDHSDKLC